MAKGSSQIDFSKLTIEETLKQINVNSKTGLSEEDVKSRLKEYGANELPEKEESTWHRSFRRFWGPIHWMIEIAAILSSAVQKWEDFGIIRKYRGWVGYISPTAEFTPKNLESAELHTRLVYQVRVYARDSRGELPLGMPATVTFETGLCTSNA